MLQRIQSAFLLLAVLASVAVLFVPSWEFTSDQNQELISGIMVDGPVDDYSPLDYEDSTRTAFHMGFAGMMGIAAVILLVTIFMYNDRKRQISFSYAGIIPLLIGTVMLVLLTQKGPSFLPSNAASGPSLGLALPVIALIAVVLAVRFIRKDDNLVKSLNSDRIR